MDYLIGLGIGWACAFFLVFCIEQDMIEECQEETN